MAYIELYEGVHTAPRLYQWLAISSVSVSGSVKKPLIIILVRIPMRRDSRCIGLWLQLYYQRMFTLHTKGDGIPTAKWRLYSIFETGIRVRLFVCEWALTLVLWCSQVSESGSCCAVSESNFLRAVILFKIEGWEVWFLLLFLNWSRIRNTQIHKKKKKIIYSW